MREIYILVLAIILLNVRSEACTIVYSYDGQNAFAGNNEDFLNNTEAKLWFVPGDHNHYGAAFWGFDYYVFRANWIPQGGMNEHGLFFDRTAVPESDLIKDRSKKDAGPFFLNKILRKCKTVQEVVDLITQYNLKFFSKGQILFADRNGDCVIIDHNHISRSQSPYAVAVNFRQSDPGRGGYPSKRYDGARSMLEKNPEASFSNFESVLEEVAQTGMEYSTIYSQICDLKAGKIRLYQFRNFENFFELDLAAELQKGKHNYTVSELFQPKRIEQLMQVIYQQGMDSCLNSLKNLSSQALLPPESELRFVAKSLQESHLPAYFQEFSMELLSYYPDSDKTMILLGKHYLRLGELEKGKHFFEAAYECNPNNYLAAQWMAYEQGKVRNGNTTFRLKGFQDARLVTICFANENWEDYLHVMQRKDGGWLCSCDLYPGDYQYVYKVDGQYVLDPGVEELVDYSATQVMVYHK